ncbi:DNA repair protein RecN [Candidatus Kinetoplastibacterium blastocrithidii TCC012E]|uniref:DNA repair protein RecN n=1 Tax=Candidatus Kinetoplastidibacterium blastocrithidiae TCC012E TaxID=1208922 RepID=M1M0Z9_9PROT|nr:DNA repair protein RecN [Candidatus Kinetoplastibacterium blastocrithidii]AFZ83831.1 DNA repair protein RecN [Candidatus Kinetoplastibacterium blastocrithidii (ex Strigomonas culicis)]AGF49956.1 DNA repair protein RecN [Candidatus Kinetoplastibacterium blastocrithidii TCC012E]
MLKTLSIKNFIIVKEMEANFDNGFTVFSGETGAGKSILIDALSLALGNRPETNVLREGASYTEIIAIFDNNEKSSLWLEKHGIKIKSEITIRRIIDKQSRSKGYINNTQSTMANLRSLGSLLVKIYGQYAHQDLLNSESQRTILDSYGGHEFLLQQTKYYWKLWRSAKKHLESSLQHESNLQNELDQLHWQENEIELIKFSDDELLDIYSEYKKLSNIENIVETCNSVIKYLDDSNVSAHRLMNKSISLTQQIIDSDPSLLKIYEDLLSAQITVKEVISDLNSYMSKIEIDPNRLKLLESRISDIETLSKKLKTIPQNINNLHKKIQNRIKDIKNANIDVFREQEKLAKENYINYATQLSRQREKTAIKLSEKVTGVIKTLAMHDRFFKIEITNANESSHGIDNVRFLVSDQLSTPKPIIKIASGGEMSRIYLAISVTTNYNNTPTIVFDEIDIGIGGSVAENVGKLLKKISKSHQIMVITHLPQVASYGDNHFLVDKYKEDRTIVSKVSLLSSNERTEEIARMLGGIEITETTINHAKEMLVNTKNNNQD